MVKVGSSGSLALPPLAMSAQTRPPLTLLGHDKGMDAVLDDRAMALWRRNNESRKDMSGLLE